MMAIGGQRRVLLHHAVQAPWGSANDNNNKPHPLLPTSSPPMKVFFGTLHPLGVVEASIDAFRDV